MFRNRTTLHRPDPALIERFQWLYGDIVATSHKANARPSPPEHQHQSSGDDVPFLEDFDNLLQGEPGVWFPGEDLDTFNPFTLPPQHTQAAAIGALDPFRNSSVCNPNNLNQLDHFQRPYVIDGRGEHLSLLPGLPVGNDLGPAGAADPAAQPDVDALALQEADQSKQSDLSDANFRFSMTLQAPTAMTRHPHEIPVTYLNRGKTYTMFVTDLLRPSVPLQAAKYRTHIRIVFEDQQQRSDPAAYWELWKRNHWSDSAYKNGNRIQAVDYVDLMKNASSGLERGQTQLESASLDGFTVTYVSNASNSSAYSIPMRFNFLSTDFSFSKGVKGIPLRLYAKTELVSRDPTEIIGSSTEARFCNIKVFRDHGAERKIANDIGHVEKKIAGITLQIAQVDLGYDELNKRRLNKAYNHRSTRVEKPSYRSTNSQNGSSDQQSLRKDLHDRLAVLQNMLTSTRLVSSLYLLADEQDDPTLYPVHLSDGGQDGKGKDRVASHGALLRHSTMRSDSGETSSFSAGPSRPVCSSPGDPDDLHRPLSEGPGSLACGIRTGSSSATPGHVPVSDVDSSYQSTPPDSRKLVACFYVAFGHDGSGKDILYYAIYPMKLTVLDLMREIAQKKQFDLSRITRVFTVKKNGLKVIVDDDVVRELPEGQDMLVSFSEAPCPASSAASPDHLMGLEVLLAFE